MKDLDTAVKYLRESGFTCVLVLKDRIYTSQERGVKPLLDFINSGISYAGFSAADRVVGKGAAFLYVLMGVKNVWAEIMSEKAQAVFEQYGIHACCETHVPAIKNRAGTGFCPIEEAVDNISSAEEAFAVIQTTLKRLSETKGGK
ncbi:MAG: DUF1893 domain-containing protein [Clostridiales bacterium]|nr:DUF1893 domain-containing protein [Clostridiales bacterium]